MKEAFHAAPQNTEELIIIHRHWCDCRSKSTGLPGETQKPLTTRRMKGQNARQPCRDKHVGDIPKTSESRSQWNYPENTRTGPPVYGDRTPEVQGHRTWHPRRGPKTSQDPGLRGIQDFARPRTSWDSRLRETRDFMGFKTSQDIGLHGI